MFLNVGMCPPSAIRAGGKKVGVNPVTRAKAGGAVCSSKNVGINPHRRLRHVNLKLNTVY
jgi:hypothetical protein